MAGQNLIISVETYKNNYPEVMDILKDLLTNPVFPQNELTKSIAENTTYLEGQLKDPQALAQNELFRLANPYPKESVFYMASLQEQIDNTKKVTRDEVVNYYQNIMGANNGFGTVLGNLDPKIAANSLESTFGKWTAKSKSILINPTFFETKKIDKKLLTPDKENAMALGMESFKTVSYTHLDVYKRQKQYDRKHYLQCWVER